MSKVKGILALCALMTMSIALIGCSGDKAKDSSEIVVGIPQDLEDSLDPHKHWRQELKRYYSTYMRAYLSRIHREIIFLP